MILNWLNSSSKEWYFHEPVIKSGAVCRNRQAAPALLRNFRWKLTLWGARSLPDEGSSLSLVMAFVLAIGVFQRHPVAATPNTGARSESYEARKQTFRPTPRTLLAREVPAFEEKRTM